MNIIAFGYNDDTNSERHVVVKHIRSIWIKPISYEFGTDKPISWMIGMETGDIVHSITYNNYDEASLQYHEIVKFMIECKY